MSSSNRATIARREKSRQKDGKFGHQPKPQAPALKKKQSKSPTVEIKSHSVTEISNAFAVSSQLAQRIARDFVCDDPDDSRRQRRKKMKKAGIYKVPSTGKGDARRKMYWDIHEKLSEAGDQSNLDRLQEITDRHLTAYNLFDNYETKGMRAGLSQYDAAEAACERLEREGFDAAPYRPLTPAEKARQKEWDDWYRGGALPAVSPH